MRVFFMSMELKEREKTIDCSIIGEVMSPVLGPCSLSKDLDCVVMNICAVTL